MKDSLTNLFVLALTSGEIQYVAYKIFLLNRCGEIAEWCERMTLTAKSMS